IDASGGRAGVFCAGGCTDRQQCDGKRNREPVWVSERALKGRQECLPHREVGRVASQAAPPCFAVRCSVSPPRAATTPFTDASTLNCCSAPTARTSFDFDTTSAGGAVEASNSTSTCGLFPSS